MTPLNRHIAHFANTLWMEKTDFYVTKTKRKHCDLMWRELNERRPFLCNKNTKVITKWPSQTSDCLYPARNCIVNFRAKIELAGDSEKPLWPDFRKKTKNPSSPGLCHLWSICDLYALGVSSINLSIGHLRFCAPQFLGDTDFPHSYLKIESREARDRRREVEREKNTKSNGRHTSTPFPPKKKNNKISLHNRPEEIERWANFQPLIFHPEKLSFAFCSHHICISRMNLPIEKKKTIKIKMKRFFLLLLFLVRVCEIFAKFLRNSCANSAAFH